MKDWRDHTARRRSGLVALVALAGLVAALLWTAGSWAQSPIPHAGSDADGELGQDCLACHQAGVNGASRLAGDHVGRGNDDCLVCHHYTGAQPSFIPHPVQGQEGCLECHEAGIGSAGALAGDHVDYTDEQCLDCHLVASAEPTPTPEQPTPTPGPGPAEGPASPADCLDCHQFVPVDTRHAEIVGPAPGDVAEGQALFAEHCTSCHGENGEQAVETATGEEIVINSTEYLSQRDDAAIIVQIAIGEPDLMPAFGPDADGSLSWAQVRSVAAFIRAWAPHAIAMPSAGDASYGAELYAEHCAACHGSEGQGGPVAPEPINSVEYLVGIDDEALRQVILEGVAGMPGYGNRLSDEYVADLIAFIRSWQR